ncbi:MAG: N-methylhydantoinase B [Natronomonas sp.]|jgi:N-methylhydantoinase B
MSDYEIDPVTFKITQHRLFRITDEAVTSLKKVSGSPVTNEAHDLLVALYTKEGELLTAGLGYLHHMSGASRATKHIIEQFEGDINEGDRFLLNDPYIAALHAPDMYIISPIFHDGELQAFSACFVHVSDIGAVNAGGFCPDATTIYDEGFQTPGLKLVEEGELRQDVLDTILGMTRDPEMVELDLRSLIVANNVAEKRLKDVIDEYGSETIEQVGETLIERSEESFRQRLSELPDGRWESRTYFDSPAEEKTYPIKLAVTNEGDSLHFEFSELTGESDVGLNCSKWSTVGAIFAPLLTLVGYDINWNEGVLKPVDVTVPDGTILNANRPAPVSMATTGPIQVVNKLATVPLSKMLGSSEAYADDASATWRGSHCSTQVEVQKPDGESDVQLLTDSFTGGGGGRAFDDGVDLAGELANAVLRWGNVERHERSLPVAYLYRRFRSDSGGAGKHRGGVGHEFALTPVPSEDWEEISLSTYGRGIEVPHAGGLYGGYPALPINYSKLTDTGLWDGEELVATDDVSESAGEQTTVEWGSFSLDRGDVYQVDTGGGGGGYGDPIERDPQRIRDDVSDDKVSAAMAEQLYGVPMGADDPESAADRRETMRANRRSGAEPAPPIEADETDPTEFRLGEELTVVRDGSDEHFVSCADCSTVLCSLDENWREHASICERPATELGYEGAHEELLLRECSCPVCGVLFDTTIAFESAPLVHDTLFL